MKYPRNIFDSNLSFSELVLRMADKAATATCTLPRTLHIFCICIARNRRNHFTSHNRKVVNTVSLRQFHFIHSLYRWIVEQEKLEQDLDMIIGMLFRLNRNDRTLELDLNERFGILVQLRYINETLIYYIYTYITYKDFY